MNPVLTLSAAYEPSSASSNTGRLHEAAQQFEALLIGEMLKTAREESDEGWLGGGGDAESESAFGLAETQFAQTIASHGGLGLANTIERSVSGEIAAKSVNPSASGTNSPGTNSLGLLQKE